MGVRLLITSRFQPSSLASKAVRSIVKRTALCISLSLPVHSLSTASPMQCLLSLPVHSLSTASPMQCLLSLPVHSLSTASPMQCLLSLPVHSLSTASPMQCLLVAAGVTGYREAPTLTLQGRKEHPKKSRIQGHPLMSPATEGGEQWPMRRVLPTKTDCSRTYDTMAVQLTLERCGVVLDRGWGGTAPGSQPERSPTSATDYDSDPSGLTMDGQSWANGQQALKIVQWNAEGVLLKKTELQHFLKHTARTADPGEKQNPCRRNPEIRSS